MKYCYQLRSGLIFSTMERIQWLNVAVPGKEEVADSGRTYGYISNIRELNRAWKVKNMSFAKADVIASWEDDDK